MKKTVAGILAHVDAGKTTLSEAFLYVTGARRSLGRVDHRDAFLDTHQLERARGITIFSKQALFSTENREFTLVDTPGHVDFSAEAERTLPILDCAILVISGTDGVQAHTATIWKLLESYGIPTFLFINKMDLAGAEKETLLATLQRELSPHCLDFSDPNLAENAALCDEAVLETFLQTGTVTDGNLRRLIAGRKLFPCCFGSALHVTGVSEFLSVLDRYAPDAPENSAFGARVQKISHDPQGTRLTWLKVTGGSLKVRSMLDEEKIQAIRLYSGDKFTTAEEALPGTLCAVAGLSKTYAGQGLGTEPSARKPAMQPVMTYRVLTDTDPALALPKLKLLEQEDPQLRLLWQNGQIQVQIMGKVQLEVFRALVQQRFGLQIQLADPKIYYLETIENEVEGIGHFEPLRHYAEVHILLSPLPRGSGLQFESQCPTDVLDASYQSLILTHMAEKLHRGVLTGAPITDIKMTLLVGRAHLKHTEGGDMRQATYRAIRQGLMQARSRLLEPWYRFSLRLPAALVGRAITDIRAMGGEFDPPENEGETALLQGLLPAAELGDYAQTLAAYTQGRGQLQLSLEGYLPCHDQASVVEKAGYDPEADVENTPDSVFCAHGAGFQVKWHQVREYMHLDSGRKDAQEPALLSRNLEPDDKALEAILRREFGTVQTKLYRPPERQPANEKLTIRPPRQQYLIVDGYNIIFAWEELAQIAASDISAARRRLCDLLASYTGFKKCRTVVVFDGYKQKGNPGEKSNLHNLQVVYTKENETADSYIEALAAEIGPNYNLRIATSDGLVQLAGLRSGLLRMSARELKLEVEAAQKEMRKYY